jgi:hypothetical protein
VDLSRQKRSYLDVSILIQTGCGQRGEAMKDMQACLDKLRADAAECALIRDQATDAQKRELFARLAEHLGALASEVERSIVCAKAS